MPESDKKQSTETGKPRSSGACCFLPGVDWNKFNRRMEGDTPKRYEAEKHNDSQIRFEEEEYM